MARESELLLEFAKFLAELELEAAEYILEAMGFEESSADFTVIGMYEENEKKGHPYSPCNNDECLVRMICKNRTDIMKYETCPDYNTFFNAVLHKNPYITVGFVIFDEGIWHSLEFVDGLPTKEGFEVYGDYNKHVEYTKYLESLPYYDKL